MVGEQFIQLCEFGNDVIAAVPIQSGAAVDADFFGGQPFDTAGEAESAIGAGQRAKTISQQRPRTALFSEAVVVVRFGVMNVSADARTLAVGVIEVIGDLATGIILEKFRISPLHAAVGQQRFGGFPRAAQAFEQENGFGKFILHAGNDVLPRGHGNLVSGITPETVHASPAPDQKRIGDFVPKRDVCPASVRPGLPRWFPTRRGWRMSPSGWRRKNPG